MKTQFANKFVSIFENIMSPQYLHLFSSSKHQKHVPMTAQSRTRVCLIEEKRKKTRNSFLFSNKRLKKATEIETHVRRDEKCKELIEETKKVGSLKKMPKFINEKATSHGVHALTAHFLCKTI